MERWRLNLYTIWFTQILSIMSFSLGMPFMVYYMQELGETDPERLKWLAGLLSSGPAIMMGIMAPVWGRIADRFGKKLMVMRAVIAGCIIMLGLGMATQVWQLVTLRMIQGMFTGTVTAAAALVASTAPENRMGYALGFMTSSTAIGASLGPAFGGLMAEWLGYRYSFLVGAGILFIDVLLVLFLVQESIQRKPLSTSSTSAAFRARRFSLKGTFVTSKWFVAAMLMLLVLRFTHSIFNPFMPILVQDRLNSLEGAAGTTGLINAFISMMMATSGILLGKLSDRYDRIKLLRIYTFCGLLIAIPLYFMQSIWVLMVNYGLMMFFVAGIEPVLMGATTSRIARDQRGSLFGIQTLIGSIGWGLSPMLGGYISIQYSVTAVLLALPACLLVEFILSMTVGRNLGKPTRAETASVNGQTAS